MEVSIDLRLPNDLRSETPGNGVECLSSQATQHGISASKATPKAVTILDITIQNSCGPSVLYAYRTARHVSKLLTFGSSKS